MFGYRLFARASAIFCIDIPRLILTTPIAFGRRPEEGRDLRAPPLLNLTLITMIPGLALYPRRRALSSRVGRSNRFTVGSFLQETADLRSQSFNSGLLLFHCSPT